MDASASYLCDYLSAETMCPPHLYNDTMTATSYDVFVCRGLCRRGLHTPGSVTLCTSFEGRGALLRAPTSTPPRSRLYADLPRAECRDHLQPDALRLHRQGGVQANRPHVHAPALRRCAPRRQAFKRARPSPTARPPRLPPDPAARNPPAAHIACRLRFQNRIRPNCLGDVDRSVPVLGLRSRKFGGSGSRTIVDKCSVIIPPPRLSHNAAVRSDRIEITQHA